MPGAAVPGMLVDVAVGAAIGAVVVFLLSVVAGVVHEQVSFVFVPSALLQDIAGTGVFAAMAIAGVCGLIATPALVVHRGRLLRAAQRVAEQDPARVPPSTQRRELERPPAALARRYGIVLLAVGVVPLVLIGIHLLIDPGATAEPESWSVFAASSVLVVAGLAITVASGPRVRAQAPVLSALQQRWALDVPSAQAYAALRREELPDGPVPSVLDPVMRRRLTRVRAVLRGVVVAAGVAWVAVIFLHKPCRLCAPIEWPAAERPFIDGYTLLSSGLAGCAVLAGVAAWWIGVAWRFAAERAVFRTLDGPPRRIDDGLAQVLLLTRGAGARLGRGLAALAAVCLAVAFGEAALGQAAPTITAFVVAAVAALAGAVVLCMRGPREASLRELLRTKASPNDPFALGFNWLGGAPIG
ncbi:hypothetical protein ACTJJZ_12105 [Microbacterium sp. 22242]